MVPSDSSYFRAMASQPLIKHISQKTIDCLENIELCYFANENIRDQDSKKSSNTKGGEPAPDDSG